ncbi:MAG: hypothetical protein EBQ89_01160 [Alphaproteobacteria bacterium]|nr:hypothetical protein [Alphaproteobacteria bacterium]
MATYSLNKFAQPDILKKIKDENLLQFLSPYTSYLEGRGFKPKVNGSAQIDYDLLCRILMQPTEGIPPDMVDALFFVHEVADDEMYDELLEMAKTGNVTVPADCTPADLAVLLWLKDPELIKKSHAEALMMKPKSFNSFQSEKGKGKKPNLSSGNVSHLESLMDVWFEQNKRGKGCKVLSFDMDYENKVYFLVRHGMPFKREGKIEDGETGSVFYRPEFHDVVIYDIDSNELQIFNKSGGKKERAMYLSAFGQVFFNDTEYFPNEDKFTLQPLLDDGVNSLSCLDIDGLAEVRLTEVQLLFRGPYNDRTILRSKDIFKSLEGRKRNFPDYGTLVAASFQVKFDSSSKPRTVKIKTPNIASFDRKEDAHIIEQWMKARGFIKPQDVVTDEDTDEVVTYVAEAAVA